MSSDRARTGVGSFPRHRCGNPQREPASGTSWQVFRLQPELRFSAQSGRSLGRRPAAIYTCVLAYLVSTALADFALASIVISGLITSVLVAGVYWIDRHRNVPPE